MTPEGLVVAACLEYLRLRGILAWRNNSGAATIGEGSGRRFVRFGLVGSADIIGVMPGGRFLAVECKAARGRLSEAQGEFLRRVQDAGGVACVVHGVDELEDVIRRGA